VKPSLTLAVIAPPLRDIGLTAKRADLVVVCSLPHHPDRLRAVEHDEREICQIDLLDLREDTLTRVYIHCCQLLLVQGVEGWVAVEVNVGSRTLGRNLVAREQLEIVGVIKPAFPKLRNVLPAS
jgi:hypothetical protein